MALKPSVLFHNLSHDLPYRHQNILYIPLTLPFTLPFHMCLQVKRLDNRLTPDVLGSILKTLLLCIFARHHSLYLFLYFYPHLYQIKKLPSRLAPSEPRGILRLAKILQSHRLLFNMTWILLSRSGIFLLYSYIFW